MFVRIPLPCSEPTFAKRQAMDLISHLSGGPLSNTATEVLDFAGIVQVRPMGVSNGCAAKFLVNILNAKRAGQGDRHSLLGYGNLGEHATGDAAEGHSLSQQKNPDIDFVLCIGNFFYIDEVHGNASQERTHADPSTHCF
jgi:hypothetical protein